MTEEKNKFEIFEKKLETIPYTKKKEQLDAICEILDHEDKDLLKTEVEFASKEKNISVVEIERYVNLFLKNKTQIHQDSICEAEIKKLKKKNSNFTYIPFRNNIIEITEKCVNLIFKDEKTGYFKYPPKIVLGFSFKLIYWTFDENYQLGYRYTFKTHDRIHRNLTINEIFKELRGLIYDVFGRDVLRHIIYIQSLNLEEREAKYILGWNDGWYLPFLEANSNWTLINYTVEHINVYNNCRNMIKKYSKAEKVKIVSEFKDFINRTQIHKDELALIIYWSMASIFKTFLLKEKNIFPHIVPAGEYRRGRSSILKSFTHDFVSHYKEDIAGDISFPRFSNLLSTCTFAFVFEEFEHPTKAHLDLMKVLATGIPYHKRQYGITYQIKKPQTCSIAIASNEAGDFFMTPANSSRGIVMNLKTNITPDKKWIEFANKIPDLKLFSFIYELTKNWTNIELKRILDEAEEIANKPESFSFLLSKSKQLNLNNIKTSKKLNLTEVCKKYRRVEEIFIILLFGKLIFEKAFGFTPVKSNMLSTLMEARKEVFSELIYQFKDYCVNLKLTTNPYRIPLNLNNNSEYAFTSLHLEGFNKTYRLNYTRIGLYRALQEYDPKHKIFNDRNTKVNKVQTKYIAIKSDFLGL